MKTSFRFWNSFVYFQMWLLLEFKCEFIAVNMLLQTVTHICAGEKFFLLLRQFCRFFSVTVWSPVHTSCECECDTNVDVTNSQRIIFSSSTLLNSLLNIGAKGGLWRQIHVKFASHSQEVWTRLYFKQMWINCCEYVAPNTRHRSCLCENFFRVFLTVLTLVQVNHY